MAEIHELVFQHGREKARGLALTKQDRLLIDIAADIMAEESEKLGITYSGFCLTALPHKEIQETTWRREGHRLTLIVQSGVDRHEKPIGIPYGSKARMILLYLQTRAIQTNCREIELGGSMHEWLARMGLSIGGNTYRQVREQANRISSCNLAFFWQDEHAEIRRNDTIVKDSIRLRPNDGQGMLWQETVELSETFYKALKEHPVPVWEPALRHISGKSMAIDVYIWLAYRLHSLERPTDLTWLSLFKQFGAGFAHVYHFKPRFLEALKLALAVYPEARVDINKGGLKLFPSPSPVSKNRLIGGLALPGSR